MLNFFYIEECWEIIVCVDIEIFYTKKYWEIIICVDVGK